MTRQEVITKLLDTYSKYGVTSNLIEHVVKKEKCVMLAIKLFAQP